MPIDIDDVVRDQAKQTKTSMSDVYIRLLRRALGMPDLEPVRPKARSMAELDMRMREIEKRLGLL